ncbi:DDE_3 domain-containing protein [Trichonephila clavipes]|nr:DDE_3 domain-containing protein [Trichonephila clavipes]
MLNGRTPLHVFERGSVASERYKNEDLKHYVHIFIGGCGPEFILIDDNARPHKTLNEFLQSEDIRRIDWPPGLQTMYGTLCRGQLQLAIPLRKPSRKGKHRY